MSAEWLDVPIFGEEIMASVQSSFLQYRMVTRDMDAAMTRKAAEVRIEREVAQFRESQSGFSSSDELADDYSVYTLVVAASGLDEMSYAKALMQKVISGGSGKDSYASKLTDGRYSDLAAYFQFDEAGGRLSTLVANVDKTVAAYEAIMVDSDRDEKLIAKDIAEYLDAIGSIGTVADLMKNKAVLTFGLRAHGLEGLISQNDALLKAFAGDASDLVFSDDKEKAKFSEYLKTFSFDKNGDASKASIFVDPEKVVSDYVRQSLEKDIGERDENVRLALYFQRKAADINNFYDILADKALAAVIRGAFGMPDEMAGADIDAQARALSKRINIEDLQDPEKVEKLIQRFLILTDTSSQNNPILSLFNGSGASEVGIGYDLLMTMQSVKR